jgi:hypothetical protein
MITLARLDQSARALGDPSAALPVATAFLGPEQPSKDAVYVDFASVILFGDQVDQFAPWNWPAGALLPARWSGPRGRGVTSFRTGSGGGGPAAAPAHQPARRAVATVRERARHRAAGASRPAGQPVPLRGGGQLGLALPGDGLMRSGYCT